MPRCGEQIGQPADLGVGPPGARQPAQGPDRGRPSTQLMAHGAFAQSVIAVARECRRYGGTLSLLWRNS